ncbi:hypothetical protein ACQ9LF_06890 [Anaerohalosphaeraceae bacterium U12dextr]|jgi:hypothetical protein
MDIFWNMNQRWLTMKAEKAAEDAKVKANDATLHLIRLEEKVDHLALKCQALWELVKEQTQLTDMQIAERISEIDMRDGVADGKITQGRRQCSDCGRAVGPGYTQCLFCGAPMNGTEIFEP